MKVNQWFKAFFVTIGIYDVLLGGVFLFFYKGIYTVLNITLPNHPGYIYVPALFLVSAGIGEFFIARDLLRNIDLAIVRLLMKLSFAGVIFYLYFTSGIPAVYLLISSASILGVIINVLFIRWAKSSGANA